MNSAQNKQILLISLAALLGLTTLWLYLPHEGKTKVISSASYYFGNKLVKVVPIPLSRLSTVTSDSKNFIYVLGGSPDTLDVRFKTAAYLYRQGISKKICFLDNPGLMEFIPSLNRNITQREWAIRKLMALGVKKEDIEPILTKRIMFGTLSEARNISKIAETRNTHALILVSSRFHTERVWESFSNFNKSPSLNMYVYPSGDNSTLGELLLEYFKLQVYRFIFLLP